MNKKRTILPIILVDPIVNQKVASFSFLMFTSHPYSSKHFEAINNLEKHPDSGENGTKIHAQHPWYG